MITLTRTYARRDTRRASSSGRSLILREEPPLSAQRASPTCLCLLHPRGLSVSVCRLSCVQEPGGIVFAVSFVQEQYPISYTARPSRR
jgi:hypothetical protein